MKLYVSPGACSLFPHIVARELELPIELEAVDLSTKKTHTGADFRAVNPKGYVPFLVLDDGESLSEASVIGQYLADVKPEAGLLAAPGSRERLRAQEWLAFIATELHKGWGPLWQAACTEEWKTTVRGNLGRRIALLEQRLADRPFLMGEAFTLPDAYAFTVLGWARWTGVDLAPFPHVGDYLGRIKARPSVQAAYAAEKGLR